MSPGEKRRRKAKAERQHQAYLAAMKPLIVAGCLCSNCKHLGEFPDHTKRPICTLQSDFHGYALTKLTDLCPVWERIASDRGQIVEQMTR